MARRGRAGVARWLVAMATVAMPPARRDWGRGMAAELAYARSGWERARLVLGAVRVALLPRPGGGGYRAAAGRSATFAVLAYLPLGLGLFLANVVFAARQDSTPGVLAMYGYVLAALMAAGALARRVSARPGAPVIAGLAAGLVIAVLAMATFAAIDNAFLSVVMHQQGKLDGFRDSDMTSMRAYINSNLEGTAPGVVLVWTGAGAVFASLGAALAREVAIARAQLPRLLRR